MNTIKAFAKKYWKLLLLFTVVGLASGYFVSLYSFETLPEEMLRQAMEQGLTKTILAVIGAVQSAGYGLVLGAVGIVLAQKVGCWQDKLEIHRKPLTLSVIASVAGGMLLILPDLLFFGNHIPAVRDSYAVKPTIAYILATVTYGAIIEEVMLRLFFLSLIAVILHFLFERGKQETSQWVLVVANVIAAILFAAGHLPATFVTLGAAPMILLRCFLLNGTFGLVFGWLYCKYGIVYAMIAHGGCHVVSKLIWILFV